MLYHVSSHMSIQLFDILSVGNVVNSQNTPSVYFCVYVYVLPRWSLQGRVDISYYENKPGTSIVFYYKKHSLFYFL